MSLQEIAAVLRANPVVFIKKEDVADHIEQMAQNIYSNPKQRRNRDLETIRYTCSSTVIEFALENLGFKKNPKEMDKTDPDSYYWDNSYVNSRGVECFIDAKRMAPNAKWFSSSEKSFATTKKNLHKLSFIITAYLDTNPEDVSQWRVEFAQVIATHSFERYWIESNYKGKYYYNYRAAGPEHCAIITAQKTTEAA